ncbi:sulfotransferase [Marimonas sp. MJW-29]|uniref:Sulfotransferase n=1 Tax=Sulfitobacter sediminis TaxID=3234186 RepID=A0ABV3RSH7_9RHOB
MFVLSAGRSGSTLLTRMLQQNDALCSVSEFWTSFLMQGFGDPVVSGARFWELLSVSPTWFGNFVAKARAAEAMPSEIIYDEARGRYRLEECPPLLTMTLPALTDDPDSLFDLLADEVPRWGLARVSAHAARLFSFLRGHFHRRLWVERSGLSYWYAPDMISAYPDARFVHLVRNGREVLLSMMGMRFFDPIVRFDWLTGRLEHPDRPVRRRIFFKHRNVARALMLRFADAERVVTGQHGRARPYSLPDRLDHGRQAHIYARFWAGSADLALQAMESLPPERLHVLRYEDMVDDPRGTLGDLMAFMLPGEDHVDWIERVAHMPRVQKGRWDDLDPEVARQVDEIIAPVNVRLGYG